MLKKHAPVHPAHQVFLIIYPFTDSVSPQSSVSGFRQRILRRCCAVHPGAATACWLVPARLIRGLPSCRGWSSRSALALLQSIESGTAGDPRESEQLISKLEPERQCTGARVCCVPLSSCAKQQSVTLRSLVKLPEVHQIPYICRDKQGLAYLLLQQQIALGHTKIKQGKIIVALCCDI